MQNYCCCSNHRQAKGQLEQIIEAVHRLSHFAERLGYRPGQVLFYQDHDPCGVFLLEQGRVLLHHSSADRKKCDLVTSSSILFGLYHLVSSTPHCTTATADTEIEVLFLPKAAIKQHMVGDITRLQG